MELTSDGDWGVGHPIKNSCMNDTNKNIQGKEIENDEKEVGAVMEGFSDNVTSKKAP